jgi:hypothetical protein
MQAKVAPSTPRGQQVAAKVEEKAGRVCFVRTIFPHIVEDYVGGGARLLLVTRCVDLTASASAILITKLAAELLILLFCWWVICRVLLRPPFCFGESKRLKGLFASLNTNILNRRRRRSREGFGGRAKDQVEPVASSLSAILGERGREGGERRRGDQVEPIEGASSLSAIRERGDLAMAHTSGLPGGNEDPPEWLTMPPNEAWFKAKQGDKDAQFIMGKG